MLRLIIVLIFLCSCSSEPEVKVYRQPKSKKYFGETPSSWMEQPAEGMRTASFLVKGTGGEEVDISVIYLKGGAGSDLANINRWRRELELPPVSQEELITATLQTKLGPGKVVDLVGKNERIFVAFIRTEEGAWFFKMKGDTNLINRERDNFITFVKSFEYTLRNSRFSKS